MKVAVLRETAPYETRVAAVPDSIKRLAALGLSVTVEAGAGEAAGIPDSLYTDAGAAIAASAADAVGGAAIVLCVQRPDDTTRAALAAGTLLIGTLGPYDNRPDLDAYAAAKVESFALELLPRITRAQAMDVLSSQANLAGYRAVIEAQALYQRAFPMMMTAAGTVSPARVLVMGAGVAGLQAIATARRLGAVVSATDVRMAAKEQVESLGASFLVVEGAEDMSTAGGYAKEASEDFRKRQAELVRETLKKTDIVITTALIPGRPAPKLITPDMIEVMKPGSVIVDLAAERGGNVEGTQLGQVATLGTGVQVVGYANLAGRIAADASQLYGRNLVNFLGLFVKKGDDGVSLQIDDEDELIKGTRLTHDGQIVHPNFAEQPAAATA